MRRTAFPPRPVEGAPLSEEFPVVGLAGAHNDGVPSLIPGAESPFTGRDVRTLPEASRQSRGARPFLYL